MSEAKLDFSFKNNCSPRKGRVLISDPFSTDSYFTRSVVYLCEQSPEGTMGFILTNYLDVDLHEIANNFPPIKSLVSLGGPVQPGNIFFLHTLGDAIPDSVYIGDSIYLGGDYNVMVEKVKSGNVNPKEVRFFLGYSGWSAGQLEEELQRKNWIVAPVLNPLEIMDTTIESIWQKFMKRLGKKYDILSKSPLNFHDN